MSLLLSIVLPLHRFTVGDNLVRGSFFSPVCTFAPSPASSFYLAVRGSKVTGSPVEDRRTSTMLRDHYLRFLQLALVFLLHPALRKNNNLATGSCDTSGTTGLQALSMGPFNAAAAAVHQRLSCVLSRGSSSISSYVHLLYFVSSSIFCPSRLGLNFFHLRLAPPSSSISCQCRLTVKLLPSLPSPPFHLLTSPVHLLHLFFHLLSSFFWQYFPLF